MTANQSSSVVLLLILVVFQYTKAGDADRIPETKGRQEHPLVHGRRFGRDLSCPRIKDDETKVNGHLPLTKNQVKVKFLKEGWNTYIARVTWTIPKVNGTPASIFRIKWGNGRLVNCKVVKNTTSFDIKQSSNWSKALFVMVIPFPVNATYENDILNFSPRYQDVSTPPTRSGTVENKLKGKSSGKEREAGNSSKIIIGSVTGGFVGILLVVSLAYYHYKSRYKTDDPPYYSDVYYTSYFCESERFLKKVENVVSWLRSKGFDVLMDTLLSGDNAMHLKEMGRFRFGAVQIGKARNVLMIVSRSYLKLCRLDEQEANAASMSQEERVVYSEIVQIRSDLCQTMYRNDRFIPILFDVKETELPYWMKELIIYAWPEDRDNDKLLYRLNNKPEYAPVKFSSEQI